MSIYIVVMEEIQAMHIGQGNSALLPFRIRQQEISGWWFFVHQQDITGLVLIFEQQHAQSICWIMHRIGLQVKN